MFLSIRKNRLSLSNKTYTGTAKQKLYLSETRNFKKKQTDQMPSSDQSNKNKDVEEYYYSYWS